MKFFDTLRRLWARPVTAPCPIDGHAISSELKKLGGGNMKVKVKSTGEIVTVPNSPTVQLMIKTGQVEPVIEQASPRQTAAPYVAPKTPARFGVLEEPRTGNHVIIWNCTGCSQGGRFVGTKPDKVHLLRAWHCGHEGGERVPAEVAARYIMLNKPSEPLFYPGQFFQPKPQLARAGDGPEEDYNKRPIHPAAVARLEAESRPADFSARITYEDALKQYEASIKEADERDAEERRKANPAHVAG